MKVGVADFGLNVWDGGCFDTEARLAALKDIGYQGVERLEAISADHAVARAARFHQLGMDFATCRGPNPEVSMQWAAAFGRAYVWVTVAGRDLDTLCRQASVQGAACARWGVTAALHNHLGTPVETQEQLEKFLRACPDCGLILDTAHLAAAGGDPIGIVRRYPDRLAALHVKDWLVLKPEVGLDRWTERGRFCELGAGNVGLDNAAVVQTARELGFDGWVLVEQDTHLGDPLKDLAVSRRYLREAGV